MYRINLLDLGRFLASCSVLFFHYFYKGIEGGKISTLNHLEPISSISKYGFIGVPFFFMISGYVIFFSALKKSAYQFLVTRMKRLFPAYWIAVIFTSIIAFFLADGGEMAVTLKQVVLNLSMLQNYMGIKSVDGVYWTLFFELRFYLLVFFIMFFFSESVLLNFFKIWPFLILLSILTGYFKIFFGSSYAFFSFGVLIAMYSHKRSISVAIPLLVSVLLCFYAMNLQSKSVFDTWVYSSFCLLFITFFYSLRFERIRNIKIPYSYILGALTYPIYLIHAHFGYMFLSKFATPSNATLMYLTLILIVLFVAYTIHHFIEVKLKDQWNIFFSKLFTPVLHLEILFKKSKFSRYILATINQKDRLK